MVLYLLIIYYIKYLQFINIIIDRYDMISYVLYRILRYLPIKIHFLPLVVFQQSIVLQLNLIEESILGGFAMNILIVDDDRVYLRTLNKIVTDMCDKQGITCNISTLFQPYLLLDNEKYKHYDIILLDIDGAVALSDA